MQEGRLHLAWTNRVFLQNIKSLVDTQKGSEGAETEVCSGDLERHEPFVKRLQGKASQLSDADLVDVLRMRKAKKDSAETVASTPSPEQTQPAL